MNYIICLALMLNEILSRFWSLLCLRLSNPFLCFPHHICLSSTLCWLVYNLFNQFHNKAFGVTRALGLSFFVGKWTYKCPLRNKRREALGGTYRHIICASSFCHLKIFRITIILFLGSYPPKRIGEDSHQCKHSYVGLWRFQFNSWEVRVNIKQYLAGFICS
jgi:hypothetical protein